nr:MAG: polyprotein 1 [Picornavirales sp.]
MSEQVKIMRFLTELAQDVDVNIVRSVVEFQKEIKIIESENQAQSWLLGDRFNSNVERLIEVMDKFAPVNPPDLDKIIKSFNDKTDEFKKNLAPAFTGANVLGSAVTTAGQAFSDVKVAVGRATHESSDLFVILVLLLILRGVSSQKVDDDERWYQKALRYATYAISMYAMYVIYVKLKEVRASQNDIEYQTILMETMVDIASRHGSDFEEDSDVAQSYDFEPGAQEMMVNVILGVLGIKKYLKDGEKFDLFSTVSKTMAMKRSLDSVTKETFNAIIKYINLAWARFTASSDILISPSGEVVIDKLMRETMEVLRRFNSDDFLFTSDNMYYLQGLISRVNTIMTKKTYDIRTDVLRDYKRKLDELLEKFYQQRVNSAGYKQEATCIIFEGESGIGKSTLANVFARFCTILACNTEEYKLFLEDPSKFIYNMVIGSAYFDGMTEQTKVVTMDEFGQTRDVVGMTDNPYLAFIMMKNSFPMGLNMAALESKGRKFFRAKFIIATTNRKNWNLTSIVQPEAVVRRFDIRIRPVVKPEYATDKGKLDPAKLPKVNGVICPDPGEVYDFMVSKGTSSLYLKHTFEQVKDLVVESYKFYEQVHQSNEMMYQKLIDEFEHVPGKHIPLVDVPNESQHASEPTDSLNLVPRAPGFVVAVSANGESRCSNPYFRVGNRFVGDRRMLVYVGDGMYYIVNDSTVSNLSQLNMVNDFLDTRVLRQGHYGDPDLVEQWLSVRAAQLGPPMTIEELAANRSEVNRIISQISVPPNSPILRPLRPHVPAIDDEDFMPGSYRDVGPVLRPRSPLSDLVSSEGSSEVSSYITDLEGILDKLEVTSVDNFERTTYMEDLENTYPQIQPSAVHKRGVQMLINSLEIEWQNVYHALVSQYWTFTDDEIWIVVSYAYQSENHLAEAIRALRTDYNRPLFWQDFDFRMPVRRATRWWTRIEYRFKDLPGVWYVTSSVTHLWRQARRYMETTYFKVFMVGVTYATGMMLIFRALSPNNKKKSGNSKTKASVDKSPMLTKQDMKDIVSQSYGPKTQGTKSSRETIFRNFVTAQSGGGGDSSGDEIIKKIDKNIIKIEYFHNDSKTWKIAVCATVIRGRTVLLPFHTVAQWISSVNQPNGQLSRMRISTFTKPLTEVLLVDLLRGCSPDEAGLESDMCFLKLPRDCPLFADITSYFVSNKNMHKLCRPVKLTISLPREQREVHHVTGSLASQELEYPTGTGDKPVTLTSYFFYGAPTIVGDCGIPICVSDKTMGKERICSMHVGGNNTFGLGYGTVCTQEFIRAHCDKYEDVTSEIPPLEEVQGAPVILSNYFSVLGRVEKGIHRDYRTAITKSPLHGVKRYHLPKQSIVINRPDEDGDPYEVAMKKYVRDKPTIDPLLAKVAFNDLRSFLFSRSTKDRSNTLWSLEQALWGDPEDPSCTSMPSATSAGYPMNVLHDKLKEELFGIGRVRDRTNPSFIVLQRRLNIHLAKMQKGIRPFFVYCQKEKDERLPTDKVLMKKERLFLGSPFELSSLQRMYFGEFAAWIKENRIHNSICVGVNVYSDEWNAIFRNLQMVSPQNEGGDGDFSGFDGSTSRFYMWIVYDIICEFYKGAPDEDNQIRYMLWHEMAMCRAIWTDVIFEFEDGCNPSGNFLTTIINCIIVLFVYRLCYYKLKLPSPFSDNVQLFSYGDDSVYSVNPKVSPYFGAFNLTNLMSEFGFTYTDANKSDDVIQHKSLKELQFLKRGFKYSPLLGRFIAPMDPSNALEICQWTKRKSPQPIFLVNCVETLKELSLIDSELFIEKQKFLRSFVKALDPEFVKHPLFTDTPEEALRKSVGWKYIL